MRRKLGLLKALVPVLVSAGCSGTVGGNASESGARVTAGPASGTSGISNTNDGSPGASGDPSCSTPTVAAAPLRRLTRFEYENTVRDLLNVDTASVRDLPADEITNGFDNNARVLTVSSLHAEKYVLVSEALAKQAVQNLEELTGCTPASDDQTCAHDFARRFGRRAFRRPITAEDEQVLMTAYAAGAEGGSHAEGIEVMIRAALQSPHFLYRLELPAAAGSPGSLAPLNPYELATRLSYFIWASAPDDALLDAAATGGLSTKEQVAEKARELLASPKALVSLGNFFGQWSGLSRLNITTKNTALFPNFSSELRDSMARELPALLRYALDSDPSLATILTANVAFVDGSLAELYGVPAPAADQTLPQMVEPPDEQGRSGLLTQAGFLSVQAHPDQTSPVLRGKFVRAMLLCQPPEPPPNDVDISLPEVDEGATARERFSAHLTAGSSCSGCHVLMDPIGLTFEHFDAMGQSRQTENGQPIDVSGEVTAVTEPALAGAFSGVRELAHKLAASEQVRDCMATQLFRFGSGRTEADADACSVGGLQEAFNASGGDLVELVVALTQTDAFFYRSQVTP